MASITRGAGRLGPRPATPDPIEPKANPMSLLKSAGVMGKKALDFIDKKRTSEVVDAGWTTSNKYKTVDPDGTVTNVFKNVSAEGGPISGKLRRVGEKFTFDEAHLERIKNTPIQNQKQLAQDWYTHLTEDGSLLNKATIDSQDALRMVSEIDPEFKLPSPTRDVLNKELLSPDLDLLSEGDIVGDFSDVANVSPIQTPGFLPSAGNMLKNTFLPQQGVAQGPMMQTLKALPNIGQGGLKALLGGGAGGAAGTAAAGTGAAGAAGAAGAGANAGLFAGMGPLGWTMLAGSLLGKLGLFKKDGLLGKIFSDERLKNNIITVGKSKTGIPIKEFGYKGLKGRYRGVISKDVPWATSRDNASGYDMVDYSKIDVPFERIK